MKYVNKTILSLILLVSLTIIESLEPFSIGWPIGWKGRAFNLIKENRLVDTIKNMNLKENLKNSGFLGIKKLTKIVRENNFLQNLHKNILEHKIAILMVTLTNIYIAKKVYDALYISQKEKDLEKKAVFNLLFEDLSNNNQKAYRLITKEYSQKDNNINYKILLSQPIFDLLTEEQKIIAKVLNDEIYHEEEEEDFLVWSGSVNQTYVQ